MYHAIVWKMKMPLFGTLRQELAAYLVARTLVRQASLADTEELKRAGYERAETYLQTSIATAGKYSPAGQRLLALVKYHLHPEQLLSRDNLRLFLTPVEDVERELRLDPQCSLEQEIPVDFVLIHKKFQRWSN